MDGPFLVSARCLKVANAATTLPVVRLMIRPDVCDGCRVSVSSSSLTPFTTDNSPREEDFVRPTTIYDFLSTPSFLRLFDRRFRDESKYLTRGESILAVETCIHF